MKELKSKRTLKFNSIQASTNPLKKGNLIAKLYGNQSNSSPNHERSFDLMTKKSWTVSELRHTKLPEQRWAIPGIIPIGLTFLSRLPKAGK